MLFGAVESKSESRERAKKLVFLYSTLREAPGALEVRRGQVADLQYFIDRSAKSKMDPNDWDGLHRLIGDPEELLTEADCRAMRRKKHIWKPYPYEWLGSGPGQTFPSEMHPKEIAYLKSQQDFIKDEIESIELRVPEIKQEIVELRLIGPLPEDTAERYKLTVDGREIDGHTAKP